MGRQLISGPRAAGGSVKVRKSHKKLPNYVADFETTTDENDCRVWSWGLIRVGRLDDYVDGISLEGFLDCVSQRASHVYFHNLAFDGVFIIDFLLKNGYVWVKENPGYKEFTSLISRMGKFYSITVVFESGYRVEFRDSYKKLPMSVAAIARAFNLHDQKLEIDYNKSRPIGYIPTDRERRYQRNDVAIIAQALEIQFQEKMSKLTVGADSLATYKRMVGKQFTRRFPILSPEIDSEVRKAYRGGFTYANPRFSRRLVGAGSVYDVNSLYPSVMRFCLLPYGEPVYREGSPSGDYPLYISSITFTAKLKKNHIPCIQIKKNLSFNPTEYISEIKEPTTVNATNVDIELWQNHYDINILSWNGTFEFRGSYGFFDKYVDHFMEIKKTATGGLRQIAKLHLNSLYGKFATNPDITGKRPVIKDNAVSLVINETEMRDPVYTPMGVFITAYARQKTISAAQDNFASFAYADTDSLHLVGVTEPPSTLDVDPVELGAWKHESTFTRAVYVRAKQYAEEIDGELDVHIAGLPRNIASNLTLDDMLRGGQWNGKLIPTRVPGGVVLRDTTFTLKV